MADAAEPSPRFVSLGDGNEVLQVALAAGDSILANERAFVYRGLGLASEPEAVGAVGRAIGWYVCTRSSLCGSHEMPPSFISYPNLCVQQWCQGLGGCYRRTFAGHLRCNQPLACSLAHFRVQQRIVATLGSSRLPLYHSPQLRHFDVIRRFVCLMKPNATSTSQFPDYCKKGSGSRAIESSSSPTRAMGQRTSAWPHHSQER